MYGLKSACFWEPRNASSPRCTGVQKEDIASDQYTPVALKKIDSVELNQIDKVLC